MIRISRGAIPTSLATHAEDWTRELLELGRDGKSVPDGWAASRYGGEDVRTALIRDTHGKCMYCEGKMRDVSFPHVEHYRPKSRFPNLAFSWSNLGLSCQVCNTNKGDSFDNAKPIVDPYSEDPEDFLLALGPLIVNRPANERGRSTLFQLGLNRGELFEGRRDAVTRVVKAIDDAKTLTGTLRRIAVELVLRAIDSDSEFSFVCRETTKVLAPELLVPT